MASKVAYLSVAAANSRQSTHPAYQALWNIQVVSILCMRNLGERLYLCY